MKRAAIWVTLRLPTRVSPMSPTFSLPKDNKYISTNWFGKIVLEKNSKGKLSFIEQGLGSIPYGATVAPVKVPKKPFSNTPAPCHPIPLLITYGGGGVAPANRETA